MKIKYLDLPKLQSDILTNEFVFTPETNKGFRAYSVNEKLLNEVQNIFNPFLKRCQNRKIYVWYQIMDTTFNNFLHKDDREYAISYILDDGGKNVETVIYDDDLKIVDKKILEINRWHIIKTSQNHLVNNIQTKRTAISISLIKNVDNKFLNWLETKYI